MPDTKKKPQRGNQKKGHHGNKKNKGIGGRLRKRAMQDVRLANRPALNELERQRAEAEEQLQEDQERVNAIYGGVQNDLAPLAGQYDAFASDIQSDLTGQVGQFTDLLGSYGPAGELAAAGGLFGNIGAGGQQLLASDRMRNLGYQTSTQRQAGMERAKLRRDYLEDFRDIVDDIAEQRLQMKEGMGPAIVGRLNELRDQRKQYKMWEQEFRVAKAQFEQEFGLKERSFRAGRSDVRRANRQQTESDERARRQGLNIHRSDELAGQLNRLNRRLGRVGNRIENTPETIGAGPSGIAYPNPALSELLEKQARLQRKKRRKRRRRSRINKQLGV